MPAFEYKALNRTGREQTGIIESDTARQARQLLRGRGLNPLEINPVATEKGEGRLRRPLTRGMSATDLALMTRQLATLVRSGTPLEDSLATTA